MLVARRVERDGDFYAGPFLPAKLARRTMALTHKLFGIRSCNEVITGQRGAAVSRVRHQALPGAVRRDDLHARALRQSRSPTRGCFSRAGTRSWPSTSQARMVDAAGDERFEEAAQLRDAMRTVEACASGSRRWPPPSSAIATCSASRSAPSGAIVQVFLCGGGRVVERVRVRRGRRRGADTRRARPTVIEAALQQFYADQDAAAGDSRAGRLPEERRGDRELAVGARRPQGADRRAAARRQERADGARAAQRRARLSVALRRRRRRRSYDALEMLQAALRLPDAAAADRVLRHLDDPGQRDRGVDGGVRGRPDEAGEYRKFRVRGSELAKAARTPCPDPDPTGSSTTSRRWSRSCAGATARCSRTAGRFPISIVIDGGKGQLNAAYAALESVGLANLVAIGLAKKEELVFTRDSEQPLALDPHGAGAAAAAADPRRGAPLCGHVPPPGARPCAICGRSSTRFRASARGAARRC